MTLNDMAQSLCDINTGSLAAPDQLRELHSSVRCHLAQLRELLKQVEEVAIEHIEATGEDIDLGDGKRWYVGSEKKVRGKDDTAILHAILAAVEGDVGRLTTGADGVLASSPWKHGAVKSLIGQEQFDALFETTITASLETGAVKKVLKVSDPARNGAIR